jgi:RNA:NAD 2'-phosphotransferase (TPT1/KptA family)
MPRISSRIREIVQTNDKRRYTLSTDGRRIRAALGHSVEIDLGLAPVVPPEVLYYGPAAQNLDAIFETSHSPDRRSRDHISPDPETATRVGQRHGMTVVLRVYAICHLVRTARHQFFEGARLTTSETRLAFIAPLSAISFR